MPGGLGPEHVTGLRIDGGFTHSELNEMSVTELAYQWGQLVSYCERRAAAERRAIEEAKQHGS